MQPSNSTRFGSSSAWLVIFTLIAACFAAVVFFPEQVKKTIPVNPGDTTAPTPPASVTIPQTSPEPSNELNLTAEPLTLGFERTDDDSKGQEALQPTKPAVDTAALARNDEAKNLLKRARDAYQGFEWSQAQQFARQITQLSDVDPQIIRRSQLMIDMIPRLIEMFDRLDERNELQRNFSSHPLQVTVRYRGREMNVIPVTDLRSKSHPDTDNPAKWVESEVQNRGKVTVLMASNGTGTTLEQNFLTDIQPVDLNLQQQQLESDFAARLQRLKSGDLAQDPLSWYAAARHAYQNRLDQHVTSLLERAIYLNPRLTQAIRNDKAQDIYAKLVDQLQKNNRAAAKTGKSN